MSGMLVLLYFEKAFGSPERNFVYEVLTFLGLGDGIVKLFTILYDISKSCIQIIPIYPFLQWRGNIHCFPNFLFSVWNCLMHQLNRTTK